VPPVAVVVCSRNRAALLGGSLASIVAALRPGDEAIVVDSASKGVGTLAAADDAGLRAVRCDRPGLPGPATPASVGPPRRWSRHRRRLPGRARLARRRRAGLPRRHRGFAFGRVLATGGPDERKLSARETTDRRRFEGACDPAEIGHGANMAFRRAALEKIGGFDELLGAGARFRAAEDHDAVWRALGHGWAGVYEPAMIVRHEQHRDTRQWRRVRHGYGIGAGAFAMKAIRLDGAAAAACSPTGCGERAGVRCCGRPVTVALLRRPRTRCGRWASSAVPPVARRKPLDGERFAARHP